MKFNDVMFDYHRAELNFSDALCDAGFGDFNRISGDHYDNSIEFYGVEDGVRINEAAQRLIHAAGFGRCWTNHKDGSEWYYSWWRDKEFRYTEGSEHMKPRS